MDKDIRWKQRLHNLEKMTKSRNLTIHTYNQETANRIVNDITKYYYSLIKTLVVKLKKEP